MTTKPLPEKRYYSIGEVATHFEVSTSLIRFWETEFPQISPSKSKKGERRYTQKTIAEIDLVYGLVKKRGFTLKGAKKELEMLRRQKREKARMVTELNQIKQFLQTLLPA